MKVNHTADAYPLSPMQQGMLFHSLIAGESGVYVEQIIASLHETLNLSAFEQAWQRVIDRHPILRSSFRWENLDEPVQEIHSQVNFSVEHQDWRELPISEQEERLQIFLEADRQRGFDLTEAPLMRAALIHLAEADYRFIWTFHHALLDGQSLKLTLNELFSFYEAFCRGQDLSLEPPRPFRDYIDWLQQQDFSKAETFWRQTLSGLSAPTSLAAIQTSNATSDPVGSYAEQEIKLSAATTSALQSLAKAHHLTLNTLFQGAWAVLLSRYSGEEDVVFGATRAGRRSAMPGAEKVVGFFVNTLPVRVRVSSAAELLPWLQELRAQQITVRDYEHTPLVKVQGWSEIPRGTPLFESILNFQNPSWDAALRAQGGKWLNRDFRIRSQTNYPLSLDGYGGPELVLRMEYDRLRFDQATIDRMLGHLKTLLEGMAAQPEQCLSSLPLLTEPERRQLLAEWNNTRTDYPQEQPIHHLFEVQVERTPDAVALVFPDINNGTTQLTYHELNRRANQLARYLRTMGVGPGTLVGICMERSAEIIIGLLGVLKAGAAYVPLDPMSPRDRLAAMLADTQAPVLLTQKRLTKTLPEQRTRTVYLDADWEIIARHAPDNLMNRVTPDNPAYVIFTSGSTGRSKGVIVNHSSLVNAYFAWEDAYELRSVATSHLQMANFSFDVFSGDWVRALCSGGKLVLCPQEFLLAPERLYGLMLQEKVNCAEFVPVVFRSLVQYLEETGQTLDFMRVLIVGSDSWYVGEYQEFQQFCGPETRLINSYGLTEATIDSTYFAAPALPESQPGLALDRLVPIGRPFANTQLYILDPYLQPVPIGVPGELHVGGAGLAAGYLNRPELTAEKFIPDPFSPEPGARLYKTGDLARYLADGNVELLGRIDYQVKIRGFRIEPGEIEAVLNQHPAVAEAVVLAQQVEHAPDQKRLVAYVIPAPDSPLAEPQPDKSVNSAQSSAPVSSSLTSNLRHFLQTKLPDYMVPSAFVFLETWPLTASGKINRRALPAPDMSRPELADAYLAPRNPTEELLSGLWAEVLGLDRVGVEDNFFELGGHSLQAVQLISRMSAATKRELSLKVIFSHPTVAALTAVLDSFPATRSSTPHAVSAKPARSPGQNGPVPAFTAPSSSWATIERRSLLSLLASGKLSPVDSAALYYVERTEMTPDEFVEDWFDNLPVFTDVIETKLGRTALIILPYFDTDLYADEIRVIEVILAGLEMARYLGARTVSLTGLIPSATHYGQAIISAIGGRSDLPAISTGHATTIATVVMAIKKILAKSGRDLTQERVGVLGLGSIGAGSLRLMLASLPHPAEIILCDLYSKRSDLEKIKQEIVADFGFQGQICIAESRTEAPPEIYEATLIIGATNVPDVLDITRVRPGVLIVDDSGPHCFKPELAIRRFEEKGDILFTEGGALKSPDPMRELRYMPKEADDPMNFAQLQLVFSRHLRPNSLTIMGCIFSSLLSACFQDLQPTVGMAAVEACAQHYHRLNLLGFEAADLYCEGYILPEESIRNFRRQFGGRNYRS